MGTRGVYGFYKNGESKLTYNHYDSYPSGLGQNVVDFIKSCSVEDMNNICDSIILVDENSIPTPEQISECIQYFDKTVSSGNVTEWYCLLRETQGDLTAYRDGLKYMINNNDFIKDSLFCEYGYVINLDENILEVYQGFQTEPVDNRYSCKPNNNYYSCKMINSFPLDDIPENWDSLLDIE